MKINKPQKATTSDNSILEEPTKKTWTKKRIITYIGVSSFVILALIFFLTPTNKNIFLKRLDKMVKTEQLTTDYEVTVKGTDATQSSTGVVLEKVKISGAISKDHDNTHVTVTTKGLDGLPFEVPYLDLVSYEKENCPYPFAFHPIADAPKSPDRRRGLLSKGQHLQTNQW